MGVRGRFDSPEEKRTKPKTNKEVLAEKRRELIKTKQGQADQGANMTPSLCDGGVPASPSQKPGTATPQKTLSE